MLPDPLQMNANGTHQPVLFGLVAQTTGPVIELGVGHYSTSMLSYICHKRFLLSVEQDRAWHEFHAIPFRSGCHEFFRVPEDKPYTCVFEHERFRDMYWDVAFVDHSPSTERRASIEALRNRAKYIVVHDAEPQATAYEWNGIFETFKYRYYFDFFKKIENGYVNGNGTMALSDVAPIDLPEVRW